MNQNLPKKASINRRQLLKGMSASLGLLALRGFEVQAAAPAYFTHGVASGDPTHDRVVIWSKITKNTNKKINA